MLEPFQSECEYQDRMARADALVRRYAGRLWYSIDCLRDLTGLREGMDVHALGCFVGETLVRALAGEWIGKRVIGPGFEVEPFAAANAFVNGECDFYDIIGLSQRHVAAIDVDSIEDEAERMLEERVRAWARAPARVGRFYDRLLREKGIVPLGTAHDNGREIPDYAFYGFSAVDISVVIARLAFDISRIWRKVDAVVASPQNDALASALANALAIETRAKCKAARELSRGERCILVRGFVSTANAQSSEFITAVKNGARPIVFCLNLRADAMPTLNHYVNFIGLGTRVPELVEIIDVSEDGKNDVNAYENDSENFANSEISERPKNAEKNEKEHREKQGKILPKKHTDRVQSHASYVMPYLRNLKNEFSDGYEEYVAMLEDAYRTFESGEDNCEEALASVEDAIRAWPTLEGAWIVKGNMCCELGLGKRGLKCYSKALLLNPSSVLAAEELAHLNFSLGRFEKASEYFAWALAINPYSIEHWLSMVNCLKKMKRHDRALRALDVALELFDSEPRLYHQKANLLASLGDKAGAETCNAQLLRAKPYYYSWLGGGARSGDQSNEKSVGAKSSSENRAVQSENEKMALERELLRKGEKLLVSGKFEESLKLGKESYWRFRDDRALELVCASLIALERFEDVVRELEAHAARSATDIADAPGLALYRGIANFGMGNESGTFECIDAILSSKNTRPHHFRTAGEFLLSAGERERALRCFERLAKMPGSPEDLYVAGAGLFRLGQIDESADCIARALEMDRKLERRFRRDDISAALANHPRFNAIGRVPSARE